MAKSGKKAKKYKAVDRKRFKEAHNEIVPHYEDLSNGKEVELDADNKHVKNWLMNNFVKEV